MVDDAYGDFAEVSSGEEGPVGEGEQIVRARLPKKD
jgi:hypothetical protein